MVEGFFPAAERQGVLALLEKSVVFLTANSIEPVLRRQTWLGVVRRALLECVKDWSSSTHPCR